MKSIRKVMFVCIAVMGLITSATGASANDEGAQQGNVQEGRSGGAKQRPCRADTRKLCKGIKPGEGRILACLKANATKLSQECAAKLDKASSRQAQGLEQEEDNSEK
jgi:uncharacterized protein YdbL (DUF1318 family)